MTDYALNTLTTITILWKYHFSFTVFFIFIIGVKLQWEAMYLTDLLSVFENTSGCVFVCDLGAEVGGDSWWASEGHRGGELPEEQVCWSGGETEAEKGSDRGDIMVLFLKIKYLSIKQMAHSVKAFYIYNYSCNVRYKPLLINN